jgi:hypothetical protein
MVGASGGAYFLCQGAIQLAYEACVRQRWAEYLADLASNGCPPKPGADAPVAEQAVSEADPLEKADTLVSEIE